MLKSINQSAITTTKQQIKVINDKIKSEKRINNIELFDIKFIQQKVPKMKGIQINNFFNNHISLNGKKNPIKTANISSQPPRPQPIIFSHHDQEPDSASYDTLTPQMKPFSKDNAASARKKRTNTIEPVVKIRETKKSKGKKSRSQEKLRKTVSLDKCNDKDLSDQQDVSKTLNKQYKKSKTSRNKNQPSEGVKRSKSAIIKNTHSKAIEPKQTSRHFLKQPKKGNIISADSSLKDASKKQIKKQTQNLISKKQQVECKTARVQSTKVKSRKNKDKIIGEINKSAQKDDKKFLKFLTERKAAGPNASKSYLTSAKHSKPNSAREKKPSKKLFDSKEKDHYRIEDEDVGTYRNLKDFRTDSVSEENKEVKEVLNQLQSVLQGISSRKDLEKELKKFTFKLKQHASKQNSDQNQSSLSEEEESNSEAFKRIKEFKNKLVKKKLNEAKETSKQQEAQSHRQQISASKKSSKKLLKPKKKLQDPQKNGKRAKGQNLDQNEGQMMQSSNPKQETLEPQVFKNTDQEESRYINSRNVSEFYEQGNQEQANKNLPNAIHSDEDSEDIVLNANNKKYMEFLKNLQAEGKHDSSNTGQDDPLIAEKNDNFIDDINTYLNREYVQVSKEYNSERPKDFNDSSHHANPLLERRRLDAYPVQDNQQDPSSNNNYLSDHEEEGDDLTGVDFDARPNKLSEIEELKSFQKQSDQMMTKVGLNTKLQQKKKNLTIELNQNSKIAQIKAAQNKALSSPKYDDRYPHMVKSPKFSDIQITNILAAKQKCLASKHQKMNELIQRMYEKQLVSPKSYEYYVYQLKKQYDEESEGFDGFKEQASEILNQINQQKNDIKAIDELIREQRWQEARKLMKGDHKAASSFFGFKKNKEKVYETYETYETKQKPELVKENAVKVEISPTKKQNISVIQNNINITIKPEVQVKKEVNQQKILAEVQKKEQKIKQNVEKKSKGTLKKSKGARLREAMGIDYYDSSDQYLQQGKNSQLDESITDPLDFDFEQRYKLKSNDDNLDSANRFEVASKLGLEVDSYLNTFNVEADDFEHYVYYQSEPHQEANIERNNNEDTNSEEQLQRLQPSSVFKLFEVAQTGDDDSEDKNDDTESDGSNAYEKVIIIPDQNNNTVIKIYQQEPNSQQETKQVENVTSVDNQIVADTSTNSKHDQEDDESDTGSILELQLRKGFESNLFFIKQYCISLCEYIRDNADFKAQFKQNISLPLQFDIEDLLTKYRKTLDGTYSTQYNSTIAQLQYKQDFRKPPNQAISSELANDFNKTYGPLKFWNRDLSKKGREKFNMQKEAQQIFLSAILQVLNESLDFERPGSIFGKPLAWANKSKHLKNMKYLNGQKTKKVTQDSEESAETYDFIFGVAIARIIQWGSCLCGFLPDTAELQNTEIDDDYVVHIRQTRMAFLLQKMLAQEEATFNNSELEETEIMLFLGKEIWEELVKEAVDQVAALTYVSINNCAD